MSSSGSPPLCQLAADRRCVIGCGGGGALGVPGRRRKGCRGEGQPHGEDRPPALGIRYLDRSPERPAQVRPDRKPEPEAAVDTVPGLVEPDEPFEYAATVLRRHARA